MSEEAARLLAEARAARGPDERARLIQSAVRTAPMWPPARYAAVQEAVRAGDQGSLAGHVATAVRLSEDLPVLKRWVGPFARALASFWQGPGIGRRLRRLQRPDTGGDGPAASTLLGVADGLMETATPLLAMAAEPDWHLGGVVPGALDAEDAGRRARELMQTAALLADAAAAAAPADAQRMRARIQSELGAWERVLAACAACERAGGGGADLTDLRFRAEVALNRQPRSAATAKGAATSPRAVAVSAAAPLAHLVAPSAEPAVLGRPSRVEVPMTCLEPDGVHEVRSAIPAPGLEIVQARAGRVLSGRLWVTGDGQHVGPHAAPPEVARDPLLAAVAGDGLAYHDQAPARTIPTALVPGGRRIAFANYFHFVTQVLARLALLRWAAPAACPKLPVVVPAGMPASFKAALSDIGYPERQRVEVAEGDSVAVETPWLLSPADGQRPPVPAEMAALRALLGVDKAPEGTRSLYITRTGHSGSRQLVDAPAIEARFEAAGFEPVDPARLSFREQVETFRQARAIVGPGGAGFANIAFAPPGCRVCVLAAREAARVPLAALAACTGQSYAWALGDTVPEAERSRHFPNVPFQLPEQTVTQALAWLDGGDR